MRAWFLTVMMTLPALAQPGEGPRAELRERVRQAVVQRLSQQLALDAPTAARFDQVTKAIDDQIAGVQADNRRAHHELKLLLDSGRADEASVARLSDRILANRAKVRQLEDSRLIETRKVLKPVDFARLLVVFPQINKQIHEQIMRAAKAGEEE